MPSPRSASRLIDTLLAFVKPGLVRRLRRDANSCWFHSCQDPSCHVFNRGGGVLGDRFDVLRVRQDGIPTLGFEIFGRSGESPMIPDLWPCREWV